MKNVEQEQTIQSESQSSVEFQSSTKGIISFKVKVYNIDPDAAFEKAIILSEKAKDYCKKHNGARDLGVGM